MNELDDISSIDEWIPSRSSMQDLLCWYCKISTYFYFYEIIEYNKFSLQRYLQTKTFKICVINCILYYKLFDAYTHTHTHIKYMYLHLSITKKI